MKHYIIAKFKEGCRTQELIGPIRELFEETLTLNGIHGVKVKPCCVARPNRFDIMIEIDMDREALEVYDACEPHRRWKQEYADLLSGKVIFDSEE